VSLFYVYVYGQVSEVICKEGLFLGS
jgi:hypothetical protein